MKVQVTRDKCEHGWVDMWPLHVKMVLNGDRWVPVERKHNFLMLCILNGESVGKDCKKQFGFTPRKGTCKQYELILKEL